MKIQLSTWDAKWRPEVIGGRETRIKVSLPVTGPGNDGPREVVDCASLPALRAAIATYGAKCAAAMPGISFEVTARPVRGERKMRGFDDATERGDKLGREAWILTDANA